MISRDTVLTVRMPDQPGFFRVSASLLSCLYRSEADLVMSQLTGSSTESMARKGGNVG